MTTTLTSTQLLRNVGISAHIDSGKTTLTERMLYYCGRIHEIREVHGDDGGATMDSDPIEKRRGITIASAATSVQWSDHHLNLIDTPGHVDFTIEVERSLRVLDGAVLVLCSVGGVQSQSITVDRQMRRYGVPRIALVNKMDRTGADPNRVVEQLDQRLDANPVLLQMPVGCGEAFEGVIDLIAMQAVYFDGEDGSLIRREPIPDSLRQDAENRRTHLVESLAMLDESLMQMLLDGHVPSEEQLHRVIRCATISRTITPVLLASAYKNKGVQLVLDAIRDYLPDPSERNIDANEISSQNASNGTVQLATDVEAPTVAMAFKTVVEPFGQLTFLRVYQGRIRKGEFLKNTRTRKRVRFGRLVRVHADKREEIEFADAGDIVAVVGVVCATGDTFVAAGIDVQLENIVAADPVVRLAIAPTKRDDIDKLRKSLDKFRREDPTFKVNTDPVTGEIQIAGMGQLHLDVYVERLRDECDCPCVVGTPSVTYKERPTKTVDFRHRLKKQNGGTGQFAEIAGRLEPLSIDANESFVFEDRVTGGRLSRQHVSAVRDGVRDALAHGPIDGYEMVGVKLVIEDGSEHEKDSSELAFRLCAAEAMRSIILPKCQADLLEPMMQLEIEVPSEFQGTVTGHLGRIRGVVTSSEVRNDICTIHASAPLAELFDYASELRSMTQGKGSFAMQPDDYRVVPQNLRQQCCRKS